MVTTRRTDADGRQPAPARALGRTVVGRRRPRPRARVYRLAYRLTGNQHDAEDLTQEVFVRVFRSLSQYTPGTFEGWLHRITTNLFLDQVRRKARIRFEGLPEDAADRLPSREIGPAQLLDDRTYDADVQAALDALPPDFRVAVVLCDIEGLTYEEISDLLGIKLGTVRSRIHRGRAQLRDALAHRTPRPPPSALAAPGGRRDRSGPTAGAASATASQTSPTAGCRRPTPSARSPTSRVCRPRAAPRSTPSARARPPRASGTSPPSDAPATCSRVLRGSRPPSSRPCRPTSERRRSPRECGPRPCGAAGVRPGVRRRLDPTAGARRRHRARVALASAAGAAALAVVAVVGGVLRRVSAPCRPAVVASRPSSTASPTSTPRSTDQMPFSGPSDRHGRRSPRRRARPPPRREPPGRRGLAVVTGAPVRRLALASLAALGVAPPPPPRATAGPAGPGGSTPSSVVRRAAMTPDDAVAVRLLARPRRAAAGRSAYAGSRDHRRPHHQHRATDAHPRPRPRHGRPQSPATRRRRRRFAPDGRVGLVRRRRPPARPAADQLPRAARGRPRRGGGRAPRGGGRGRRRRRRGWPPATGSTGRPGCCCARSSSDAAVSCGAGPGFDHDLVHHRRSSATSPPAPRRPTGAAPLDAAGLAAARQSGCACPDALPGGLTLVDARTCACGHGRGRGPWCTSCSPTGS